jgi:hypothetical protein
MVVLTHGRSRGHLEDQSRLIGPNSASTAASGSMALQRADRLMSFANVPASSSVSPGSRTLRCAKQRAAHSAVIGTGELGHWNPSGCLVMAACKG